jgi:hypothetical protein
MQAIKFNIGPLLGVLFMVTAVPAAEASTITDVSVTIGGTTFTSASVGWSFPYTLLPGQGLVLTQSFNGPPNTSTSFSFDTSDLLGALTIPQIAITADGVTTLFSDLSQVLNVKGIGTLSNFDNKAQNYGAPLLGPGYQVFLGYADNTNTGACGAWATSIGLIGSATCFPSVFSGATFFDGAGALSPAGLVQTLPNHCDGTGTVANCYDGGVIMIVATSVPVPDHAATMTLLLSGLAVIGAGRWRQRRCR